MYTLIFKHLELKMLETILYRSRIVLFILGLAAADLHVVSGRASQSALPLPQFWRMGAIPAASRENLTNQHTL